MAVIKISLLFVFCSSMALAIETDQFTVPPKPLEDSAPLVSQHVLLVLNQLEREPKQVDPAAYVYKHFGHGFGIVAIENWLNTSSDVSRFSVSYSDSVYQSSHPPVPEALHFLAPTIKMYGIYFGTDKIGHIFQQGYEYYKIFEKVHSLPLAITHGVKQEEGIYGLEVTGVYSNGDLAGNYAGLKFYLNLTQEVQVGSETLQPILILQNDKWALNSARNNENLLKPFISWHLNEAFNPSYYTLERKNLEREIKKRCQPFFAFYGSLQQQTYDTWFGEDYGYRADGRGSLSPRDLCGLRPAVGK